MNSDCRIRDLGEEHISLYAGQTEKERKIDYVIAETAKRELAKGSDVRTGYMIISINGTRWKWDEEKQGLVKVIHSERVQHQNLQAF